MRIWGSPYSSMFHNWAFMEEEEQLAARWAKIPEGTDILITHGPPLGVLDQVRRFPQPHVGSESLMRRFVEVQPKLHVFGHIHEAYGRVGRWVNASTCTLEYSPTNPLILVDI